MIMGSQFWWIYDAAAAAVVLVCVFIMGKKGFIKSAATLVCAGLALVIAYSVSGTAAAALYKNNIRSSNITKLEKTLNNDIFNEKLAEYIEGLGYNVKVNEKKLVDIFNSDKDLDEELCKYINNINGRKVAEDGVLKNQLHEGYAQVMKDIVSKELASYAASEAESIILEDASGIHEVGRLMLEDTIQKDAAAFIADNYTAPAYRKVVRYVSFIAMFIIIAALIFFILRAFLSDSDTDSVISHVLGGVLGIGMGAAVIFVIAVMIRLYVLMGSNEMMIFNLDTINSTYVFRYFYELALGM